MLLFPNQVAASEPCSLRGWKPLASTNPPDATLIPQYQAGWFGSGVLTPVLVAVVPEPLVKEGGAPIRMRLP